MSNDSNIDATNGVDDRERRPHGFSTRRCEHCGATNFGGARFCFTQACGGAMNQLSLRAVRS